MFTFLCFGKRKIILHTIIRWPPGKVTAFQVVWTSFLGPRPRLFPLHPAANQYATFENNAEIKWTFYVQGFSIDKREAGGYQFT